MDIKGCNYPLDVGIGQIIVKKGLKQKAVAERCGWPQQVLSDMLNGRRLIKACDIPIIAQSLDVSVDDLYRDFADTGADTNEQKGA